MMTMPGKPKDCSPLASPNGDAVAPAPTAAPVLPEAPPGVVCFHVAGVRPLVARSVELPRRGGTVVIPCDSYAIVVFSSLLWRVVHYGRGVGGKPAKGCVFLRRGTEAPVTELDGASPAARETFLILPGAYDSVFFRSNELAVVAFKAEGQPLIVGFRQEK